MAVYHSNSMRHCRGGSLTLPYRLMGSETTIYLPHREWQIVSFPYPPVSQKGTPYGQCQSVNTSQCRAKIHPRRAVTRIERLILPLKGQQCPAGIYPRPTFFLNGMALPLRGAFFFVTCSLHPQTFRMQPGPREYSCKHPHPPEQRQIPCRSPASGSPWRSPR